MLPVAAFAFFGVVSVYARDLFCFILLLVLGEPEKKRLGWHAAILYTAK